MNTTPDTPRDAPDSNRSLPALIFDVRTGTGTTPNEEASEHRVLVTVRGEVDMDTASQLVDAIEEVTGSAVVDLSGVTFIDSSGLHGLMRAQDALRERGDQLILRHPTPSVRRVLELTGMASVFTVEEAGPTRPE